MSRAVGDLSRTMLLVCGIAFGTPGLVVAQDNAAGNDAAGNDAASGGVVADDSSGEEDEAGTGEDQRPWRTAIYRMPGIGKEAERVMLAPSSFSGSPDVSRDGKRIALDGWQNHIGQGTYDSMVYVVDLAKPQTAESWLCPLF